MSRIVQSAEGSSVDNLNDRMTRSAAQAIVKKASSTAAKDEIDFIEYCANPDTPIRVTTESDEAYAQRLREAFERERAAGVGFFAKKTTQDTMHLVQLSLLLSHGQVHMLRHLLRNEMDHPNRTNRAEYSSRDIYKQIESQVK